MTRPAYGDVWLADFDPARGHEQSGVRPCVVVSSNHAYNRLPIAMAIVVPVTSKNRRLDNQPQVVSRSSGLKVNPSYVRPEDVRAVSTERMIKQLGRVSARECAAISDVLRLFLDLH